MTGEFLWLDSAFFKPDELCGSARLRTEALC